MSASRPVLRFLLDACVPHSVGKMLATHRHEVIYHNDVLAERSPDEAVATAALANDAVLISIDPDMKRIARRFGISDGNSRFRRLNIIMLGCNETQAANRTEQAISLIEHEWMFSTGLAARRLWVEIKNHSIKTCR